MIMINNIDDNACDVNKSGYDMINSNDNFD